MSKQEKGNANPRDAQARTEAKEMHSKDAHEAAKDRKPAPPAPAKEGARK